MSRSETNRGASAVLSKFLEITTVLITSLAAGTYCFTKGFLDVLGIPSHATFSGSIQFFASNVLRIMTVSKWHFLLAIILFLAIAIRNKKTSRANQSDWKLILKNSWPFFTALLLLMLPEIRATIPYALAITLPTFYGFSLLNAWISREQSNIRYGFLVPISFIYILIWGIPYLAGRYVCETQISPQAFPFGSSPNSKNQEILIWIDGEERVWLNCLTKKIRGELNGKNIIFFRDTGGDILNSICTDNKK